MVSNLGDNASRALRILLVDDDPAILRTLLEVCGKDGGYACTTALDGGEARALLETATFDIVLSDQRMPVMTGIELFALLRLTSPNTVRVLMTAAADHETSLRALEDGGVHAIVKKPWKLGELVAVLKSAASQARAHRIAAVSDASAALHSFRRKL